MDLAEGFKVACKPVSGEAAKKFSDELERCLGEIMTGKRKPANIPIELMVALIQFARDNADHKFTNTEISALERCPEALRVLANWHECHATEADAIGDLNACVSHHDARKNELRAEADRIEATY